VSKIHIRSSIALVIAGPRACHFTAVFLAAEVGKEKSPDQLAGLFSLLRYLFNFYKWELPRG
jgi:hypothetical protein